MEEIERQIKEIKAQISYWQDRTFDINPIELDVIKTTVTSFEYVLYNLEKIKKYYEQQWFKGKITTRIRYNMERYTYKLKVVLWIKFAATLTNWTIKFLNC